MNKDIHILFGLRIKELRVRAHISQEELSFRSGLSKNYISDVERGTRNISLKAISKLADGLKVEVKELFNLLFSPITWIIIAILVIYSFIRRYLYEKQLKEYNERIEKEIAEKKAAYQSGQAYRNGSDDVIDVNYVEKDENE